ncbi:pentapeptide repeat-containing protein [Flavobacterium restrictum]|uniref:Pentapeptide repeat-containing protein n=1 Tax=Flavobacterium restrictum TaxID=2594428 RepID=A0A553DXT8_9FLAO|nr:pentapeptide repeat-containing protein [Flavobacterium restrictum]TRX37576.1 pentapeptide repeat-containing protein [Flavobacterium restrictum]
MENLIHVQKTFEKVVYSDKKINNREFEDCVFKNCDFSNSDFSYNTFMDCEFIACNLSMMQLHETSLKSVVFKNCKVLGIQFHTCTDFLFTVHFEESILDYSSFANKKMPKTKFNSCSLREVSFVGTNLTNAVFDNCNLDGAVFNDTQLKEANFITAYNYKIDPEYNPMKKAKFSIQGIVGLLDKYDIKIE